VEKYFKVKGLTLIKLVMKIAINTLQLLTIFFLGSKLQYLII
jgi:hypothetical protein